MMTDPDTRPYNHVLTVGRSAVDTIAACNDHVEKLLAAYGPRHDYYLHAEQSLRRQLSKMFSMFFGGATTVSRDGELSLFISTGSSFVYGMIFHGIRRSCTNEGCHARINDDGTVWTYMPDYAVCDSHVLSYPLDAPMPGSWSFHS